MKTALVGYTGFVGSNIYAAAQAEIDAAYHSRNIEEAFGTKPELLIYSGMRAEKYLANTNPEADMRLVYQAEENIRRICPEKLVLISTIDVFKDSRGKDEEARIDTKELHAYGRNRFCLEQWARDAYPNVLIIRLPGLYGINIKKNFIYDFINVIPFMLKEAKFHELARMEPELHRYYELQDNGFYRCRNLSDADKVSVRDKFKKLNFTALHFTDSRNVYQFYPLARLWKDIQTALNAGIKIWHPATEPVSAGELYESLAGERFINETESQPVYYDYRTRHAEMFGGEGAYIMSKEQVVADIKKFVGGVPR